MTEDHQSNPKKDGLQSTHDPDSFPPLSQDSHPLDEPRISLSWSDSAPNQEPPKPEIPGYVILHKLGQGGMGTVWRAWEPTGKREVALKVMNPAALADRNARARFRREIELAANLVHPNIARIYDPGRHEPLIYYTMELVDGKPLTDFARANKLSTQQTTQLMLAVCLAVHHAHHRGIVHRDLKPSNILVRPDHQPCILDFGLAKALTPTHHEATMTLSGEIAGTLAYMSPEQARGDVDHIATPSDVYSLGVIFYRLLTHQFPYDVTGHRFKILQHIESSEPTPPRQITKSLDPELEAILLKALAKDPNDRYPNAGDLADDIQRYLNDQPLTARHPTTWYRLRKRLKKHRLATSTLLAATLLIPLALLAANYLNIQSLKTAPDEQPSATPVPGHPRGLWVWDAQTITDPAASDALLSFSNRAASGQIFQKIEGADFADNIIYLAADVIDNHIVQQWTGTDLWAGDHVELWLDLDLNTDFNRNKPNDDDIQFGFSPGNFTDLPPEVCIFTPNLAQDFKNKYPVQIAAVRTPHGYTIEAAIPKPLLEACLDRYHQRRAIWQPSGSESPATANTTRNRNTTDPQPLNRNFKSTSHLPFSFEVSDCDDKALSEKCLISISPDRVWGDPTTFWYLYLE